jgi:ABC-type nitrate/sulfonate/bicarbonate transport system substrate-binding protein
MRGSFSWRPLLLGACLAAALAPAARAADTVTLGVVGGAPATLYWPLHIGLREGLFAAEGIDIDIIRAQSSNNVMLQLAAAAINLCDCGVLDGVRAIASGAPVALIRVSMANSPFSLIAHPSIKRIEDLKGKTISVGGVKDITREYAEVMLRAHGVQPGQFDMIYAGGTPDRFAALKSGAAAAAMLAPPFDLIGQAQGFTNLGLAVDYVKDLPLSGIYVSRQWAAGHQAVVQRFLAGHKKSVDWFYDSRNREGVIKIAADIAKAPPEDIAKGYDFFQKIKFFEPTGKVTRTELQRLIAVGTKLGDVQRPITPEELTMPGVTKSD